MAGIYEQIGQKIRELRQSFPGGSLSQEGLATKLGKPANTVSRWETGTYKPTPEDLDNIALFDPAATCVEWIQADHLAAVAFTRTAVGAWIKLTVKPSLRLVGDQMQRVPIGSGGTEPFQGLLPNRVPRTIGQPKSGDSLRKDLDFT